MTIETRIIKPDYVSFYVAGRLDVDIPLDVERLGIIAASDCINVPALNWVEGDTTVHLGPASELDNGSAPNFDGFLETPENVVLLFDANEPEIMRMRVSSKRTRIRIWLNHPTQPDEVFIGLD